MDDTSPYTRVNSPKSPSTINHLHTHLPDQVVYRNHDLPMPSQRTMQGVLMFLDISGFTSLCERYSMNGKNGADKLTKTLNGYMGALVEEILSFDGDVLKYAGDAILTLWRIENYVQMRPTVMHVINCALSIQEKYGVWTTSVGVKLKVKLGIAAGSLNMTFVGNDEFCHYASMGRAVQAVNVAESFCESGDIVVSPTAWCHVSQLPITKQILDDKKHVLVTGLEEDFDPYDSNLVGQYNAIRVLFIENSNDQDPLAGQIEAAQMSVEDLSSRRFSVSSSSKSVKSLATLTENELSKSECVKEEKKSKQTIRKAIIEHFSPEVHRKLRLYVAKPVLRKMDDHQAIEYLSEMRQVTMVFMNLITSEVTKHGQPRLLQDAFNVIYGCVKKMQGCLNKIFMFDKGCTFLIIFGLPGFKHENDCAHALRCSYRMMSELANVEHIVQTSIGVTTGSTFCGVVGNAQRHEYTAIGRKVNMAARLMMHYPSKITCDNETFHHSKLPKSAFEPLEMKQMKGLRNVGTIREFLGCEGKQGFAQALKVQEFQFPMLGRVDEMNRLRTNLEAIKSNPDRGTQVQLIVFDGVPGIGKTRMLDGAILEAMDLGMKVISCALTMHDTRMPYFVVRSLLARLLDLDYDCSHQEREASLFETLKTPFIVENMSLLNDLLQLKLPQNEKYIDMSVETRNQLFHELLFEIVHEMCIKYGFVTFAVDDAHFMDAESWEFVRDLGQDMRSLVLLTVRTSSIGDLRLCPSAQTALKLPTAMHIALGGLSTNYISALACQILDVVEIPLKLDELLREKSHGVPSWCEQLLTDMLYDNILTILPQSEKQIVLAGRRESAVTPDMNSISKRLGTASGSMSDSVTTLEPSSSDIMAGLGISTKENDPKVCIITPGKSLEVGMPDSIKGMIQTRIDRMSEVDQMLLKCSAILGQSFPRTLLEAIMPARTHPHIAESLQRLGEQNVIECMWLPQKLAKKPGDAPQGLGQIICRCPNVSGDRMSLVNCSAMRFTSPNFQETAYEMFIESSRQTLHIAAAEFLENQAHKCEACGGGGFLVGMHKQQKELQEERRKSSMAPRTNKKGKEKFPKKVKAGNKDFRRRASLSKHRSSFSKKTQVAPEGIPDGSDSVKLLNHLENAAAETPSITDKDKRPKTAVDSQKEYNKRECQCMEILASVYPLLVRHWRAAGNVGKTINFLMEAGSASIAIYDNLLALSYLHEVRRIRKEVLENKNPFEGESTVTDNYQLSEWEEARLESLMGQALYHLGQIQESLPHFYKALDILGNPQPTSKFNVNMRILAEGWQQWKHMKFPNHYVGRSSSLISHRLMEQTRCLSHVFHDYISTHEESLALLSALQQVNIAEKINEDIDELIIAYTCMMECCLMKNWRSLGEKYETFATEKCRLAMVDVKIEHCMTVAHMYSTSLTMCLTWGRLEDAIESGQSSTLMIKRMHDTDLLVQILPSLAQAYLLSNKIKPCMETLRDLKFADEETIDLIGKTWFYNCCWDIILECGYAMENWAECVEFAEGVSQNACFKSEPLPLYYLAANVTVWLARREQWIQMETWLDVAKNNCPQRYNTYMALHALARIIEAKLVSFSYYIYKQNMKKFELLRVSIIQDLSTMKAACKMVTILKPRFLHLQAYFSAVRRNLGESKTKLHQCIQAAKSMDCHLEVKWAEHSLAKWFGSVAQNSESWVSHVMSEEGGRYSDWAFSTRDVDDIQQFILPISQWYEKR